LQEEEGEKKRHPVEGVRW